MGNYTLAEVWTFALVAASAIVLLSNAAEKILKIIKAAKAPERQQNAEIEDIKTRLTKLESNLVKDEKQIKDSKECNHVLTKGMLALLDHVINGNNISQMKEARGDVETYLINH